MFNVTQIQQEWLPIKVKECHDIETDTAVLQQKVKN